MQLLLTGLFISSWSKCLCFAAEEEEAQQPGALDIVRYANGCASEAGLPALLLPAQARGPAEGFPWEQRTEELLFQLLLVLLPAQLPACWAGPAAAMPVGMVCVPWFCPLLLYLSQLAEKDTLVRGSK